MHADRNNRFQVGLVGAGIQHSSSPSMHVDEGKALDLQISYELLDFDLMQGGAERLPALLEEAEQRGFAGPERHLPVQTGRDPAAR
jgi:shikimate dehydrogenase